MVIDPTFEFLQFFQRISILRAGFAFIGFTIITLFLVGIYWQLNKIRKQLEKNCPNKEPADKL